MIVLDLPDHLAKAPVGRDRLSREELATHQRRRIVAAAVGVFAKRGYQDTTIDNVVAAAKSSVGTFYGLFPAGKEDCFLAAYDTIIGDVRARATAATAEAGSWAAGAFLALREMLELVATEPLAARIVLLEVQTAGPAAVGRYNLLLDTATSYLAEGRRHYPQARSLAASFEQATVAGLAFYLQQRLLASKSDSTAALLDETAPLVLEPIIGAKELASLRGRLATPSA